MVADPPYPFDPIVDRDYRLPGGESLAVWVVLNVESFLLRGPQSKGTDTAMNTKDFGRRGYGSRVGLWRLIDVLDSLEIPATYALNADVCDRQPQVVDAAIDRDWAIMGHGLTNSRRLVSMATQEVKRTIRETTNRIESCTGNAPIGWLSPGLVHPTGTLEYLVDAGYSYICDFPADDQPFRMDPIDLVGVPYSVDINDKGLIGRQGLSGPEYRDALVDAFDTLREEGRETGNARVLPIPLHPHITGQPFRARYLEEALERMSAHDDVWFTTGDAIAERFRDPS